MKKNESTVYHPIGASSNVYKTCFLDYVKSQITKSKLRISIGAQPNSVPHFGTLVVFSMAFSFAKELMKNYTDIECAVLFEMVDTAPASVELIENVEYQISLKQDGLKYLPVYRHLLDQLSAHHNIPYEIRGQSDFNNSPHIKKILQTILSQHEKIKIFLAPDTQNLRIRIACPKCGRSDKKAVNLKIKENLIISHCPYHGDYCVNICENSNLLEYNTPLRNLIRQLLYMEESQDPNVEYCWIRITGSDYAGFYQEQTLYKSVAALGYSIDKLPIIIYAPLVTDWSGAKISKSLYVKENAYRDLPTYLLDYNSLLNVFGERGLYLLSEITDDWMKNPYKLFRSYSIDYFKYMYESKFG